MKSSRRAPRYRRRFLTHTRTSLLQLQLLCVAQGLEKSPICTWETLFHGLCLKSAQEVDASPEGTTEATGLAKQLISAACAAEHRTP